MDFLKAIGIDKEKEVNEALLNAGQKFAKEIGCPINDIQIAIQFDDKGLYGNLSRKNAGGWKFIRHVTMKEIIE